MEAALCSGQPRVGGCPSLRPAWIGMRDGAGASPPEEGPGGTLLTGGHWEGFCVSCLACAGTGELLHPGSTHLAHPAQIRLQGRGGMEEPSNKTQATKGTKMSQPCFLGINDVRKWGWLCLGCPSATAAFDNRS